MRVRRIFILVLFQKVLKEYSIKPEELEILEIENRSDCGEIQSYMSQLTGARSVSFSKKGTILSKVSLISMETHKPKDSFFFKKIPVN